MSLLFALTGGSAAFRHALPVRRHVHYTVSTMKPGITDGQHSLPSVVAVRLREMTDGDGFPSASSWAKAQAIEFNHDWQGRHADPKRATEVKLLWNPQTLFLRFHMTYRTITIFQDAREDGWRDQLWDRDVAEAFLQPDTSDPGHYREFEVSPNGFWIDLAIRPGEKEELHSKLRRRVSRNAGERTWTAELAIPMSALTERFDPARPWRVNFYRVEGQTDPRFYSAWSPTFSAQPNFHVPAAFGELVFGD